jgi:hypothetical protein
MGAEMQEPVSLDFNDLFSTDPRVKYSCAKRFVLEAKDNPSKVSPFLDRFIGLLECDNNVIKWTAIDVIGAVLAFDPERSGDGVIERLIGFLACGRLITANHAIDALARIGASRPLLSGRIAEELLRIESLPFESDECRNIAIGKVVMALESLCEARAPEPSVIDFAERQTRNTRNATKKKAEKLLVRLRPIRCC